MMIASLGGRVALPLFAAAAVLVPVRFSAAEPTAPATAECATCCSHKDVLCVVCEKACTTVNDAYDHGSGLPCPSSGDPNIT